MGNDTSPVELLQGTPDLLILRTLVFEPSHGHAIPRQIRATSQDVLQVETGSLCAPSIGSRRRAGSSSVWQPSDRGKRAKYYTLTAIGR